MEASEPAKPEVFTIWTSIIFFFNIYLFIYLAALGPSCSMRDLRCRTQDLLVEARGIF